MKLYLLALILSLTAQPVWAKTQKIKETALPNGLKVHEYKLDNGMQLLLVPDHTAPVFSYQVWFKVGSATEKMDPGLQKTGLAHLFEHMMFRGTPKNPDQVFDAKISAAGAAGNNATTWLDRTNYFESLPKERLELIFDLESDRMSNLALNEKLFKTELGAVFGELKMNEDKPSRVANRNLWDLAFDVHPYKWTTMGTPEELNSFTVEQGHYFYKTYYAPNNATLILVGDFDTAKAIKLAEKYYGKIPAQKIPVYPAPVEPEQKKARERRITHPLATSDLIMLAFKTPAINHPDTAAIEVLAALLSYGNSSILEQNLVQTGMASSVSAGAYKLRYPAIFNITAQTVPGKTSAEVISIIQKAVRQLREGKITTADLERAKNQFLLSSYNELLNQDSVGDALGEALVSSDDYLRGFQILEEVKQVTLEDIKRTANAYLVEDKSSLLILSPAKDK